MSMDYFGEASRVTETHVHGDGTISYWNAALGRRVERSAEIPDDELERMHPYVQRLVRVRQFAARQEPAPRRPQRPISER